MRRLNIYDYWPAIANARHNPRGNPSVVEIGVFDGGDSARLAAASPTGALDWIGFEPDPRNLKLLADRGIAVRDKAMSDQDGEAAFWLSSGKSPDYAGERSHSLSSSLNTPTVHLKHFPWCRFDEQVTVKTARLDSELTTGVIDLLWVDVQGAQRKVLAGAPETLKRTRYLYIECHATPLYDGEPTFEELCALLPGFSVVRRWESDVLFRNPALTSFLNWRMLAVRAHDVLGFIIRRSARLWTRLGPA